MAGSHLPHATSFNDRQQKAYVHGAQLKRMEPNEKGGIRARTTAARKLVRLARCLVDCSLTGTLLPAAMNGLCHRPICLMIYWILVID